tara:strand:- start:591 stop:1286 length:696 start_codon:yes stop_codon:yes gene_type:complete
MQLHEAIATAASKISDVTSTLQNGVSLHAMPQSVSFAQLRAVLAAAKGNEGRTFVGTRQGGLVVSVNFNYETCESTEVGSRKKRGRDANEEAVQAAIDRVKRGVHHGDVDSAALESARGALYAVLTSLRGARNETVVESWGLSYKKEEASVKPQRPRLILSVRMTPSVAVPLKTLFRVLGASCRSDGMITVQNSSGLASGFNLPLSEQAVAAETLGQKALTMFATVEGASE